MTENQFANRMTVSYWRQMLAHLYQEEYGIMDPVQWDIFFAGERGFLLGKLFSLAYDRVRRTGLEACWQWVMHTTLPVAQCPGSVELQITGCDDYTHTVRLYFWQGNAGPIAFVVDDRGEPVYRVRRWDDLLIVPLVLFFIQRLSLTFAPALTAQVK